jgi:hypothetical protein
MSAMAAISRGVSAENVWSVGDKRTLSIPGAIAAPHEIERADDDLPR